MMTEFVCGTRIVMGSGAVQALKEWNARRLLVVADPYFAKNGTAKRIAELSGCPEWEIFDEVKPDPTAELAALGVARIRALQPDMVVALGGGSAMDCAKAMVYFGESDARLVAIPTTSGSGSEVTDFSVLTHEGAKFPLIDPKMRPWAAILDDELLKELPPALVADAGFDVLCHALEALASKNANPISDALARDSFCAAFSALPASFAGDRSVRLRLHTAATMAGMAFSQAGLGVCHALAHSLGGVYHVPHGRLNAILLPAVLEQNAESAGEKYAQLARAAGLGGSAEKMAVRNLKNAIVGLRKKLQLPQNLAQVGITAAQLGRDREKILETVLADPCCRSNPAAVTKEMVLEILSQVGI